MGLDLEQSSLVTSWQRGLLAKDIQVSRASRKNFIVVLHEVLGLEALVSHNFLRFVFTDCLMKL